MKRDAFERYIEEKYGVQPESPWMKSPEFHVFRHSGNKKWFALTMTIPKNRQSTDIAAKIIAALIA